MMKEMEMVTMTFDNGWTIFLTQDFDQKAHGLVHVSMSHVSRHPVPVRDYDLGSWPSMHLIRVLNEVSDEGFGKYLLNP
jgi:hypothetical protein